MPRIERLHWGHVGRREWRGARGELFALWPEPVDHDVCFRDAGFTAFADTDESWDVDFSALIERLLGRFARYGASTVRGEAPRQTGDASSPILRLVVAAENDGFPPCFVSFGSPLRAVVMTSAGHPILWVWLEERVASDWSEHLAALGRDHEVVETALRWEVLLPRNLAPNRAHTPGLVVTVPEADLSFARARRLVFYVARKLRPRGRWLECYRDLEDLQESVDLASAIEDAVECGVFVRTPSGGRLYWSSTRPDLFNYTVLVP